MSSLLNLPNIIKKEGESFIEVWYMNGTREVFLNKKT